MPCASSVFTPSKKAYREQEVKETGGGEGQKSKNGYSQAYRVCQVNAGGGAQSTLHVRLFSSYTELLHWAAKNALNVRLQVLPVLDLSGQPSGRVRCQSQWCSIN